MNPVFGCWVFEWVDVIQQIILFRLVLKGALDKLLKAAVTSISGFQS